MLTIFSGHLVDPYRFQEVGITMIQTPPVLSVAVEIEVLWGVAC